MNAIIKILCRSPILQGSMQFISASNSLSPSLQSALFNVLSQVIPTKGPWEQGKQLLHHCEEAFDESAAATKKSGMPANQNCLC
jgi:hypothetical protein